MFGLFKGESLTPLPRPSVRDTLFGDLPMSEWPPADSPLNEQEPWKSFVLGREALAKRRTDDAIAHWRRVAESPGLESRHYLQAWHFLRLQGVQPSASDGKTLLGVVLEVSMPDGLDLLAAYPERTARYYNYSGAGV